jgi:hypothetical protein
MADDSDHAAEIAAALTRLEEFERSYRVKLVELERGMVELRAERDEAIRAAHRAGVSVTRIASVFKISHQRVSKLVRGLLSLSLLIPGL